MTNWNESATASARPVRDGIMSFMVSGRQQSKAEELQLEIFRRMTPQQRLECCFRWTELTYEFARSAIRQEHPEWTPRQIDAEIGRRITGIDVSKLPGFSDGQT